MVRLPLFQSSARRPDRPGAISAASRDSSTWSASPPLQTVSTHQFRMSPTADCPASMPKNPGMIEPLTLPQMPGMGPVPGQKFGGAKQQPKKKGSKSGNPAKRAAENAALAAGEALRPAAAAGSGFGLGSKPGGPSEEELASLQRFLGR